jgi:hypothetical protein
MGIHRAEHWFWGRVACSDLAQIFCSLCRIAIAAFARRVGSPAQSRVIKMFNLAGFLVFVQLCPLKETH